MGDETAITWCDMTFNPWWGCWKISPGCENCYADAFDHRLGGEHWGRTNPRRFFGDKHWAEPLKWAAKARKDGVRRRVFCASMSDVFEGHPVPAIAAQMNAARAKLWALIWETRDALDWLLLTKRPENFDGMLPWWAPHTSYEPWPNVWLGVTAEDDEHAKRRIPILRATPAAVRFVSYEPALGRIDWAPHFPDGSAEARAFCAGDHDFGEHHPGVHGWERKPDPSDSCVQCGISREDASTGAIDWVIFGDESGHKRRPAELDWARATRDACEAAGVAFHFKQWCGDDVAGVSGPRGKGKIHLPILDGEQHAEFP